MSQTYAHLTHSFLFMSLLALSFSCKGDNQSLKNTPPPENNTEQKGDNPSHFSANSLPNMEHVKQLCGKPLNDLSLVFELNRLPTGTPLTPKRVSLGSLRKHVPSLARVRVKISGSCRGSLCIPNPGPQKVDLSMVGLTANVSVKNVILGIQSTSLQWQYTTGETTRLGENSNTLATHSTFAALSLQDIKDISIQLKNITLSPIFSKPLTTDQPKTLWQKSQFSEVHFYDHISKILLKQNDLTLLTFDRKEHFTHTHKGKKGNSNKVVTATPASPGLTLDPVNIATSALTLSNVTPVRGPVRKPAIHPYPEKAIPTNKEDKPLHHGLKQLSIQQAAFAAACSN